MGLFLENNILKYEVGDETRIIQGDTQNYKYSVENGVLLFLGTGKFLNNNYLTDRNSNNLFELKQESNTLRIVSTSLGSGGLTQEEHDKLFSIPQDVWNVPL